MPQTRFGFFLKFSPGNPAADGSKPGRFIRLLYVKKHEWKRSIDANKPHFLQPILPLKRATALYPQRICVAKSHLAYLQHWKHTKLF